MTLEAPPSRYRIVEKNGRLIVTDLTTGQRSESADLPTMAELGRLRITAGPPSAGVTQPVAVAQPSTPRTRQRDGGAPIPVAGNQAKLIGLVVIIVAIAAVLLLSGLWVAVVIAMLIPQVRTPILEAGRTAMKRWFSA